MTVMGIADREWNTFVQEDLPSPKFNSEFTPESHGGKGRRMPFLLGFGNFSGAFVVKLREDLMDTYLAECCRETVSHIMGI